MTAINSAYGIGAANSVYRSQADRESAQLAIDKSKGDLSEVLFNANKKRRAFQEELDARRSRVRAAFGAGAGLSASAVGAAVCAALAPEHAYPAYMAVFGAGIGALAAFSYAFAKDVEASTATLQADANQCVAIIAQMQALREGDEHALESGQRRLAVLVTRFSGICNRHLGISAFEFEKSRRHKRYPTKRTFRIANAKGHALPFEGIDISRSGIAVRTPMNIRVGAEVTIDGGTKAKMIRPIKGGLAFEFLRVVPAHEFSVDMRL